MYLAFRDALRIILVHVPKGKHLRYFSALTNNTKKHIPKYKMEQSGMIIAPQSHIPHFFPTINSFP
jgi:hypothetical protein